MGSIFKLTSKFAILMSAVSIFTASTAQAGDLDINGLYYKKIVYMKDLVADILPPPAYIIESYLTVLQLAAEVDKGASADKAKIDSMIEYGRKLKEGRSDKGESAGYLERIEFWTKDLSDTPENKSLRNLILKKSVDPAKKFFTIRDSKFNAAIKAGKVADAKKIIRDELKPAYEAHRKAIDELVVLATKEYTQVEQDATAKLAKGETGGALAVKGKIYNRIIQMKDLIADILPPPRYIIESLLVVHQMLDEVEASAGKANDKYKELASYMKLLKAGDSSKGEIAGYIERKNYWVTNLSEKTLPEKKVKELLIKSSDEPAMKFYGLVESKLIPALDSGKIDDAKKIINTELTPLYDEHRKHIDDLVGRADKLYKQLEAEVEQQVKK